MFILLCLQRVRSVATLSLIPYSIANTIFSNSTLCPAVQSLLSGKGKACMQEGKYV